MTQTVIGGSVKVGKVKGRNPIIVAKGRKLKKRKWWQFWKPEYQG